MAGLLPGVDCARRRRLHYGGVGMLSNTPLMAAGGWLKQPSFYVYTTNHKAPHASTKTRRHAGGGGYSTDDANLGGVVREAKERLDVKLRSSLLKPDLRRSSFGTNGQSSTHDVVVRTLQTEAFMGKGVNIGSDSGQVGVKWGRMRWKSTEQEECAVCLERFRVGENLVNLKCGHRFHTRCLVPWIETNSRCPCCRMEVSSPTPPL